MHGLSLSGASEPSLQHVESLTEKIHTIVRELMSRRPQSTPAGLMLTGQMGSYVHVSRKENQLRSFRSWKKQSDGKATRLLPSVEELLASQGDGVRPELPALKLIDSPPTTDERVTTLLGFLAERLTGRRNRPIHLSDAAALGLYDIVNKKWNSHICESAGIEKNSMPSVIDSFEPIGKYPPLGIDIFVGIGDFQAAVLGSGLSESTHQVGLNAATGAQIISRSARAQSELFQTRPFVNGALVTCITHLPSGRLLSQKVQSSAPGRKEQSIVWAGLRTGDESVISNSVLSTLDFISDQMVLGIHKFVPKGRRTVVVTGGLAQITSWRKRMVLRSPDSDFTFLSGFDASLRGLERLASGL